MFASLLLAAAFQVGPFYEQRTDYRALRPFVATEGESTDVLWPVYTAHRDWWRFLLVFHYREEEAVKGVEPYQFDILPIWFNGRTREDESYWGLFPLYGHHPHIALVYDLDFVLWPVWMRYKMPRPSENRWMTSNVVLFPFVHWRDDGSWGVWPLYSQAYARESDHYAVLWPIVTWGTYREDRDTGGAGSSWMLWPLYGQVRRAREQQDLFLPPFFSYARTQSRRLEGTGTNAEWRVRCPWPFVEIERSPQRDRVSVFPFCERTELKSYEPEARPPEVTWRFGWKLVECYPDETRVFPFWVSRTDDAYFRLWPFWESNRDPETGSTHGRFLSLIPIRWVPQIDRNWSKFWTLYENERFADHTDHSLFWGIIRWRTEH